MIKLMSRTPWEIASDILLNPVQLFMLPLMLYMLFLVIRAGTARTPPSVGGVTTVGRWLPVKVTFAGLRVLSQWVAVASNNASSYLIVGQSGTEYRVIKEYRRSFADIEQVDVRTAWRTANIEIQFRGAALTFAANVGAEEAAQSALALFPASTPMTSRTRVIRGD
jgi:hypothetical protein